MRYVTVSELIYINGSVLDNARIATGQQKIRDIDLLDAAAARPAASAFGQDAYPTLHDKAAVLLHGIARNHPFTDGNKRTATIAALFMLLVNGQRVVWDAQEALSIIVDVAASHRMLPQLARWLSLCSTPTDPALDPDAEADMARIASLIERHRWLLDELNKR